MTNTKKYVNELDAVELTRVLENNSVLSESVTRSLSKIEKIHVDDCLHSIKNSLSSWQISDVFPSYIKIHERKIGEFLEGMKLMQQNFNLLQVGEEQYLKDALEKFGELESLDLYADDNNYNEVENELDKLTELVANTVAMELESYIRSAYKTENQISHFLNFYSKNKLNDKCYIIINKDGTSDFILHEDISYTKSYA